MFQLHVTERPYTDPWLLPLPTRLQMLSRGRRRVAYYYEEPNNSTFRYRAYNMAQVLNADESGETSASWFFRADLHQMDALVRTADTLVVCRSAYEYHLAQLIERFRAAGKRVLFDVDDLVFDSDFTHLIIDTLALDKSDPRVWPDWFGMISRMGKTLRYCDGAITTNAVLARRLAAFADLPVAVVPNFMNAEQLAMSADVWHEKAAAGFQGDGHITLGYFSGSPSHRHDFALVEPALEALLRDDARIQVMTVGYIEPGPGLAQFGARILRRPFHDYVNLQRLLGTVEVNLMPLQSNVFTDCKSELKYFEAAACGTISVASPSVNYASSIQDGENGFLSRAHEWTRRLREIVAGLGDYERLARAAHADALARFSWTVQRPALLAALGWD